MSLYGSCEVESHKREQKTSLTRRGSLDLPSEIVNKVSCEFTVELFREVIVD